MAQDRASEEKQEKEDMRDPRDRVRRDERERVVLAPRQGGMMTKHSL